MKSMPLEHLPINLYLDEFALTLPQEARAELYHQVRSFFGLGTAYGAIVGLDGLSSSDKSIDAQRQLDYLEHFSQRVKENTPKIEQ